VQAFGVDKESRMGEGNKLACGLRLNPTEFSEDDYRVLADNRARQVWNRVSQSMHHPWRRFFFKKKPFIWGFFGVQRDHMNKTLFDPALLKAQCGPGGRVIVFAFARAAGRLMTRFVQSMRE
jgi:hypothetical protein